MANCESGLPLANPTMVSDAMAVIVGLSAPKAAVTPAPRTRNDTVRGRKVNPGRTHAAPTKTLRDALYPHMNGLLDRDPARRARTQSWSIVRFSILLRISPASVPG